MTREEIITRIEAAGGEWRPLPSVQITSRKVIDHDNDPDGVIASVTVDDAEFSFWLMGHHSDGCKFIIQGMPYLENARGIYEASKLLAAAIDYDTPGSYTRVIEKPVAMPDERLAGKVEAYEKLLIGRGVTISA